MVAARRLVDSAVASWGIADHVAEDAALAVSEFVTNAVLHAGTVLSVRVRRLGDGVRLEVEDGSAEPLVLSPDPPDDFLATPAMTGRGLALVAATVDRWGTDLRPGGKEVWAEIGTGSRRSDDRDWLAPEPPSPVATTARRKGRAGCARSPHRSAGPAARRICPPVRRPPAGDAGRRTRSQWPPRTGRPGGDQPGDLPPHGALRQAGGDAAEAALARGETEVDFDVDVVAGAVEAFDRLGSLIRRIGDSVGRRHLLPSRRAPRSPPTGTGIARRSCRSCGVRRHGTALLLLLRHSAAPGWRGAGGGVPARGLRGRCRR